MSAVAEALLDAEARFDFSRVHQTLKRFVDAEVLPGVSLAVMVDGEVVHQSCIGWADRESRIALRDDHLFRVFSNTKLVTACAALLLVEDGLLDLDEPIARHLPMLQGLQVLRPDARSLDDVAPAQRAITARHLLTHTAGFGYARTRPGTLLGDAYDAHGILESQHQTLEDFVHSLARLPLLFEPGTRWEYSVSLDVMARLIEVISGRPFGQFLRERIFSPLGMQDTGFSVPPTRHHRLVSFYRSLYPEHPLRGGLQRCDDLPFPGAYLTPCVLQSGGGGLVSSLGDMTRLMRSLVCPRHALLRPASRDLLLHNQLPDGVSVQFPMNRPMAGRGFSFAGAVTSTLTPLDPPGALGEVQWGGIAGTHWWISPSTRSAVVIMTQRHMSFWHLFAFYVRRDIYALLQAAP